jgi:hypothetical protein
LRRDPAREQAIETFLKRYTFHCKALNVTLTPEECRDRQLREVETKYFGRKLIVNNTIFDRYCRSGCCQQGQQVLVKLEPKAAKAKLREVKHRDAPCHQMHLGVSDTPRMVGGGG